MTEKEILKYLSQIIERQGQMSERQGIMLERQKVANDNLMKVVYAFVGLTGASLGLKFVGSPPLVIVAAFVSFFAATYLIAATIGQWKRMRWLLRFIRITFALFIYFSVYCRNFMFSSGHTLAPYWYSGAVDIWFIILAVLLIAISFRFWDNGKMGHDEADKD